MKLFPILLLLACNAAAAQVKTEHVEAELVAARTAARPGETLTVALRLRMIPRWHTYWRNPGDSGQPTAIDWQLPPGFVAGPVQWPAPKRLPARHLMNYGYEDEVLLLTDVRVPAGASGTVKLVAQARWLVCNEEHCIPEEGRVALALPVDRGEPSAWAGAIERTRAALPVKSESLGAWKLAARPGPKGMALEIGPPAGYAPQSLTFFPFQEGKMSNPAPQRLERAGEGYRLSLAKSEQPAGAWNRVAGLLAAEAPLPAVEIDVPVSMTMAGAPGGLALALLLAFAGGLILNLMPCVLPVLSIKILGFAGASSGLRLHGAIYALGVVVSFLVFAGLLIALKSAGQEIGWGFQLQSPVFVAFLAALFLLLALNLSGVFEFGSFGFSPRVKNTHADAFLTGVLAVAIASPCTAPFMGAALGYALAASTAEALAVFGALGVGMALPYAALAWYPQWLRLLPKPGRWMERLKRLLALPLYATVLWLGWVLALQSGLLAGASGWEKFSLERIQHYENQGKTVFVDFTAAWCVTCQVNKQLVLQDLEGDLRAGGHGPHGAIDDKRSTSVEDVKTAKNYVRAALGETMSGKAVSAASTSPYGCTVKY